MFIRNFNTHTFMKGGASLKPEPATFFQGSLVWHRTWGTSWLFYSTKWLFPLVSWWWFWTKRAVQRAPSFSGPPAPLSIFWDRFPFGRVSKGLTSIFCNITKCTCLTVNFHIYYCRIAFPHFCVNFPCNLYLKTLLNPKIFTWKFNVLFFSSFFFIDLFIHEAFLREPILFPLWTINQRGLKQIDMFSTAQKFMYLATYSLVFQISF